MDEKTAKTKWCPMVRVGFSETEGSIFDNRQYNGVTTNCLGSQCMMWTVDYKEEKREGHSGGKEYLMKRGLETGRSMRQDGYDLYVLDESGHCGFSHR